MTNQEIRTAIHLDGLQKSTWLPAPTPLVSVSTDPEWVYDDNHRIVWSPSGDTKGLAYTTTSLELTLTPAQLANAAPAPVDIQTRYTQLPTTGINPAVKKLAGDIVTTANATTAIDKALALQNYFRSNFTYDATYRSPKQDPLGAFLAARKGFCQQFASDVRGDGPPARPPDAGGRRLPARSPSGASLRERHVDGLLAGHPRVARGLLLRPRLDPVRAHAPGGQLRAQSAGVRLGQHERALGQHSVVPAQLRAPDTTNDTTESTSTGGSGLVLAGPPVRVIPWAWLGGLIVFLVLIALPGLFRRYLRRRRLDEAAGGEPRGLGRWPLPGRSSRRPATTSAWSGPPHAPHGRPRRHSSRRSTTAPRRRWRGSGSRPNGRSSPGRRAPHGVWTSMSRPYVLRCSSVARPGSGCGRRSAALRAQPRRRRDGGRAGRG